MAEAQPKFSQEHGSEPPSPKKTKLHLVENKGARTLKSDQEELANLQQLVDSGSIPPGDDNPRYQRFIDLKAKMNVVEQARSGALVGEQRNLPPELEGKKISRIEVRPGTREATETVFAQKLKDLADLEAKSESELTPEDKRRLPLLRKAAEAYDEYITAQAQEEESAASAAGEIKKEAGSEKKTGTLRSSYDIATERLKAEKAEEEPVGASAEKEEGGARRPEELRSSYEIAWDRAVEIETELAALEPAAEAATKVEATSSEEVAETPPASPAVETGVDKAPPAPAKPEVRRAGVVDIYEKADELARHIARERLNAMMRGERKDKPGKKESWWKELGSNVKDALSDEGIERNFKKAWYKLAEDGYYKQYLKQERKRILGQIDASDPNAFAPDEKDSVAFHSESRGILERFYSEYDGLVRPGRGEKKESLEEGETKEKMRELVVQYANEEIDETTFQTEKTALIDALRVAKPELFAKERATIDNLFDIAKDFRAARAHGEKLQSIDVALDVQLGNARSAITEEAHLSAFDRLIKKMQRTPGVNLIADSTALGFITSLSTKPALMAMRWGARTAGMAALGAGALVGGVFAGLKRNMDDKTDVTHVRRGEAEGYEIPAAAQRLNEFKKFTYESAKASDISTLLTQRTVEFEGVSGRPEDAAALQQLIAVIAETESRLNLGEAAKHDFLKFSDPTKIEQEQMELLKALAVAKLKIPTHSTDGTVDTAALLTSENTERTAALRTNVAEVDKNFGAFKRERVARAVVVGAATAVVAGAFGQWALQHVRELFGDNHVPQSAIDHLWDKIRGHHGISKEMLGTVNVGDHAAIATHEGLHITTSPDQPGSVLLTDSHGEVVEVLPGDGHGEIALDDATRHSLEQEGWKVSEHDVKEIVGEHKTVSPQEWLNNHVKEVMHVARGPVSHLDNDTPTVSEFNETKLDINVTPNGDYDIDVSRMTSDGSIHGDVSENIKEQIAGGTVRILASLSRETQKLPIDLGKVINGHVIISKGSDIAKLIFSTDEHGRPVLLAKFLEAAMGITDEHGKQLVNEHGEQQFRMFATAVGSGVKQIEIDPVETTRHVFEFAKPIIPSVDTVAAEPDWEPPPAIPLSRRNPLEAMGRGRQIPEYLKTSYLRADPERRKRWADSRSPRLSENPEAKLNLRKELEWYFDKQEKERGTEYLKEIDQLVDGDPILSNLDKKTELIVCMPVAGAHEAENIGKTLELYAAQDPDSLKKTTLLLNVNWPEDADQAKVDQTLAEIVRVQKEHPELKIATIVKTWPRAWIQEREGKLFGTVVKYLNDVALRSVDRAKIEHEVYLLTNDADARGMSRQYLKNFIDKAHRMPDVDGMLGKIEWGSESFDDYPGYHITARVMQYIDSSYRHGAGVRKSIASSGANFLVKASTFAGVGGYDDDLGAGADTDLGMRIKAARLGEKKSFDSKKYPIQYNNAAWLDTDQSRALNAYKKGESIIDMWSGFDEGGYNPRGDLAVTGQGEDLERGFPEIMARTEFQVTEMIGNWVGFDDEPTYTKALDAAFPPQNKEPLWRLEQVTGSKGSETVVRFTPRGREWLKTQLEAYRREGKKDILYRLRGIRANSSRGKKKDSPEEKAPRGEKSSVVKKAGEEKERAQDNTSDAAAFELKRVMDVGEKQAHNAKYLRAALREQGGIPENQIPNISDTNLMRAYLALEYDNGFEKPKRIRQTLTGDLGVNKFVLGLVKDTELVHRMKFVREAFENATKES